LRLTSRLSLTGGQFATAVDCLAVKTFAQWADVDVHVDDVDFPPALLDPKQYQSGWDSLVTGRVVTTEPLWLATMEFEPVGDKPVLSRAGEYEFLLLARRAESVKVYWPGPPKKGEEVTEQHTLMFRRL